MRTSNKTIMMVLGVGAVMALAGQAFAQGGYSHGRDGFRGGSDGRSSHVNRGYSGGYGDSGRHFVGPRIVESPRSFHGGSYSRPSYGHSGFGGGFGIGFGGGYVESPRYFVAPRVITPGWMSYGYPVYATPQCGVLRSVYGPSCYPQHRYVQPTWGWRR